MKKRTYTLPIVITLLMIAAVIYLIVSLTGDPYEQAIKKGDRAMAEFNYSKAVSEYTIAQNLNGSQTEPYHKALTAIALASEGTLVRDALTNINNCIEFCGEGSISPEQIIEAIDILLKNDKASEAYDILNHLHISLAEDAKIKEKFEEVSMLFNQPQTEQVPEQSPTPSPTPEPVPEQIPAVEMPTQTPVATQTPAPTSTPTSAPTLAPTPTSTPAQAPTTAPSPSAAATPQASPAAPTQNPL